MSIGKFVEQELEKITYDDKGKNFVNLSPLLSKVEMLGWTVKSQNYDLIYFSDEQRRYQDYDGILLNIFIQRMDENLVVELRHLNGTKYVETKIYDPNEITDEDLENVPYKN